MDHALAALGFLTVPGVDQHHPTPAGPQGHEPQGRCLCSSHCRVCPQFGLPAARLPWHSLNTRKKKRLSLGPWDRWTVSLIANSQDPQVSEAHVSRGRLGNEGRWKGSKSCTHDPSHLQKDPYGCRATEEPFGLASSPGPHGALLAF